MGNCCYEWAPPITAMQEYEDVQTDPHPQLTIRRLEEPKEAPADQKLPEKVKEQEVKREEPPLPPPLPPEQKKEERNRDFEELINIHKRIESYYANHDVDSCMPLIQKLEKIAEDWEAEHGSSLQEQLKQYCDTHSPRITRAQVTPPETFAQIRREHQDIIHYEQEITNGQWKENSCEKGIRLSTRREDGSVGVLIELELELPFEVLIAVLIEVDLYTEFIAFNKVSRQEKVFSRNCRIGYNLNDYPFLAKRQAFFQGIGYSRLRTHREVFLFTRSIHDKPDLQKYLQYPVTTNPDYVQLTYKYFVVRYRPIRPGKGQLTMALNADIGLNFLPNFILEYLAKDFARQFVESILEIGSRFKGSAWQKNVEKNPDLFNFYKSEIENYFKEPEL